MAIDYEPPTHARCRECRTNEPFSLESDADQIGWYAYCPTCGNHTPIVKGILNAVNEWNIMNDKPVNGGQPVNNDYEWNLIRQM